jgi:hypothetical protein
MNDECPGPLPLYAMAGQFLMHHSSFLTFLSPLDLARLPVPIPLGRGVEFVLQGDYMLPDGGLKLWGVAQESGIVVPLDGYPTSHNPGDCDVYSSIDLR